MPSVFTFGCPAPPRLPCSHPPSAWHTHTHILPLLASQLTLSKPAMFLFSAKNSAGDFCCTVPPSAVVAFFLGAMVVVGEAGLTPTASPSTRVPGKRGGKMKNQWSAKKKGEFGSLARPTKKKNSPHAAPAGPVAATTHHSVPRNTARRVGGGGCVSFVGPKKREATSGGMRSQVRPSSLSPAPASVPPLSMAPCEPR